MLHALVRYSLIPSAAAVTLITESLSYARISGLEAVNSERASPFNFFTDQPTCWIATGSGEGASRTLSVSLA